MRRGVDLQYHHQCGRVYSMRNGLRGRNHLSVYCLYGLRQPGLYCLYCLCGGNVQKHDLYGLGQHRMYLLRRGNNVQYDYQCGLLYSLYNVFRWNLRVHGMYCLGQSCLYGVCRWNLL